MADSEDKDRQLVDAVIEGASERAKTLLEKGASVNARDEQFFVRFDRQFVRDIELNCMSIGWDCPNDSVFE